MSGAEKYNLNPNSRLKEVNNWLTNKAVVCWLSKDAVTVGVTTQAKDAAQALAAPVMSRRILSEPTDVSVSASILGTEKSGQDLVVRLSNGETLNIENFFVIGPDGDFSRLLSSDGSPVVTGLMAPEPDLAQDNEFTGTVCRRRFLAGQWHRLPV